MAKADSFEKETETKIEREGQIALLVDVLKVRISDDLMSKVLFEILGIFFYMPYI